ncbi:MAG: aminotransferase class I/II-fold pyridoxal phosphate-dependent enzyme [Pseudomonadota bacterium]
MKPAAHREAPAPGEASDATGDQDESGYYRALDLYTPGLLPPAVVPVHPVLSFAGFFGGRSATQAIVDAGDARLVTSGRIAIAMALQRIGVAPGDEVLLPAYCCKSMVDPVRWAGLEPVFYRVTDELEIDHRDLRGRLSGKTRAIIAVHFFGFPQPLEQLRELCDEWRIALIEDCAHAFFGRWGAEAPGTVGDYAIASPTKFFPVYDGGCLVSSRHSLSTTPLRGAGVKFPLKALLNTLERSAEYRRLRPFGWLLKPVVSLKDWLWTRFKATGAAPSTAIGPASADGGFDFDPEWIDVAMSRPSALLMHTLSHGRVERRRRENYARLVRAFAAVDGVEVLWPSLPKGVVPYIFPLLVNQPERVFPRLKMGGVPIFRWELIHSDECTVSADYAQRLFQLPCHQEMSDGDIAWLTDQIKAAVARLG